MKTIEAVADKEITLELDRYYYEDMEEVLGVARTAVKTRIRAGKIKPHVDENSKQIYLDTEQIDELKKVHDFMAAGGLAANYQGKYYETHATADATISNLTDRGNSEFAALATVDKYDTDLPAILDMEVIRRNALDAIATNERIQAYAHFEIYARSKQTMSDKDIEELIGFKPPRTGFKYDCYQFIRYSKIYTPDSQGKLVKQSTWLVEKFNPLAKAEGRSFGT